MTDKSVPSVADIITRAEHSAAAGDLDAALAQYRKAAHLAPQNAAVHFGLGTVCYQIGEDTEAIAALEQAAELAPDIPEIFNNLGAAYGRAARTGDAINAFQRVCILKPDHAAAAFNLGRLLLKEKMPEAAERWLTQADQHRPNHIQTLVALAEARMNLGEPHMALDVARQALRLEPDNVEAGIMVGQTALALKLLTEAEAAFRHVLSAAPDNVLAVYYLAETLRESGQPDDAKTYYRQAYAISRDTELNAILSLRIALTLPVICQSRAAIAEERQRVRSALATMQPSAMTDPFRLGGFTNFYMAYQGSNDRDIQESVANYYLGCSPGLNWHAPHIGKPRQEGRYRIAIVSGLMYAHTVGYLSRGLIEHLDRKRFEVTLVRTPLPSRINPIADEIAATADKVVDVPPILPQARRQIGALEADLVYYPEIGMEDLIYFLAFARLAPAQVMGWGHPVTSGIPNMDYMLSTNDMEPPDGEKHYNENLIRLKGLSVSVSRPAAPPQSAPGSLGLKTGAPVYLCAQSLFKIHPDFDGIIADILSRDSAGHVYFIKLGTAADALFLDRLKRTAGVDMGRVHLLDRVGPQDFIALLRAADVLLDVPHWAGGKTSLEGFAMGTPIVHWPGTFMRGRHTLAFYRRMNIMDCVADSADTYAEIAVRLVNDKVFRDSVRHRIAERAGSLFDDRNSIAEISDVFEQLIIKAR